jgi:hypothetical protein
MQLKLKRFLEILKVLEIMVEELRQEIRQTDINYNKLFIRHYADYLQNMN